MNKLSLILLLITISMNVSGQKYQKFTVGTSLTFIGYNDNFTYENYKEFTLNINAAINLTKRLQLGVQALTILSNGGNTSYDSYRIIGSFIQYDIIRFNSVRIFLESSINSGNIYLPNSEFYPIKKSKLTYLGWGSGIEIPILKSKRLFIDLSFISYSTLWPAERCSMFTQYIIGINYKF